MPELREQDDTTDGAGAGVGNATDREQAAARPESTTAGLESALRFERFVARTLHRLFELGPEDIREQIQPILGEVGAVMGADRCFVFTSLEDPARHRIDGWMAPGIDPDPEVAGGFIQDRFPWLVDMMGRCQDIVISNADELPEEARPEREYCASRGIQSFLMCPMVSGEIVVGMVDIDCIRESRRWTEEDVRRLRIAGELIGTALLRARKDRQILALQGRLEQENRELRIHEVSTVSGLEAVHALNLRPEA